MPYNSVGTKPLTNNSYVNSLLWDGDYWKNPTTTKNSTTIIPYSFLQPGSESFDDAYGDVVTQAYLWSNSEIQAIQTGLKAWSNVANISFVPTVSNSSTATLKFYLVDTAQLDSDNDSSTTTLGRFKTPGEPGMGTGYFNWQGWNESNLQPGGYGFATILHELGHGLGLAHPHDNAGGSLVFPGVTPGKPDDRGNYGLNQDIWTIMSLSLIHI